MKAFRNLLCLVFAASALGLPVTANSQNVTSMESSVTLKGGWLAPGRTSLGLNVGRSQSNVGCGTTALLCDSGSQASRLYINTMVGNFWGVELGLLDTGRRPIAGVTGRGQGLNLSLIGKAPLGHSVRVFGKVGTTWGRTETSGLPIGSAAGGPDHGSGLSFGAGLSYDLTPRLSATIEWDSNDFRFGNLGRDPVRSTNLGLQFRY